MSHDQQAQKYLKNADEPVNPRCEVLIPATRIRDLFILLQLVVLALGVKTAKEQLVCG